MISIIDAFAIALVILTILGFVCLYRAYKGPSSADRVVAITVIATKTCTIIASVSFIYQKEFFLDVALVYSLISFIAMIGVAKYLERGSC
ncbi:monovalent cation/H+ antiporter complex subunit F [Natranaerofaba carboxydovora]|uniref:monovalent cation/H+ antiporter complex subunit F n=1 Tax=Natranaerofaba carboxydovora TaxID=2742683 RepID=UPI001F1469E6|nr:monovalent cation/H+ antiporter complex subunit F [Natranaerofaba carboxydovora]UMZ72853.1 Na(+)/H(+) antiporter subunit F [Natranaerofaba carboxydovora]